MYRSFDILLTEEDYLAFNIFHALESESSKKHARRSRLTVFLCLAVLDLLILLLKGWTMFSAVYTLLVAVYLICYLLMFKKLVIRNLKAQIRHLKESGKLPFDPVSQLLFYEDRIVEVSPSRRKEEAYALIERICVLPDRYIFIYTSSVNAYILPIPQVRSQTDLESFLSFLSGKCGTVEYC